MADLIDRQAAIDAITDELTQSTPLSAVIRAKNRLKGLSAVQPDHNADVSKKAEGDCISRKTALDALAKQMPRSYTPDGSHPADEEIYKAQEIYVDCIESIEILPAIQPEIIRCKDCKYWRDDHTCHEHSLVSPMCANEYCSRAERGDDGHID